MESVFWTVLNMSLAGTAVAAFVAVFRALLKRAPRFATLLLWAPVLWRLLCPVSFPSPTGASLFGRGSITNGRIELLSPPTYTGSAVPATPQMTEPAANAAVSPSVSLLETLFAAAPYIWVVGVTVFLAFQLFAFLRLCGLKKTAAETELGVYTGEHIPAPFTLGVFSPKIYLPAGLSETERISVLRHERAHIANHDPLWKLLASLALAVHWFNPIVWLLFILFTRDLETAADERALRGTDGAFRADYAETLLHLSASPRPRVFSASAFAESLPKSRIRHALSFREARRGLTVLAAVFAVLLAVFFAGNPRPVATYYELSPVSAAADFAAHTDAVTVVDAPETDGNDGSLRVGDFDGALIAEALSGTYYDWVPRWAPFGGAPATPGSVEIVLDDPDTGGRRRVQIWDDEHIARVTGFPQLTEDGTFIYTGGFWFDVPRGTYSRVLFALGVEEA